MRMPKKTKRKIDAIDVKMEIIRKEINDCKDDDKHWFEAMGRFNNLLTRKCMEMGKFRKNI